MIDPADRCPLCASTAIDSFSFDSNRTYMRCEICDLVFVPEKFYLPPAKEKAVYDMHQNDPGDVAYRSFLSRLFEPMMGRISTGSSGLDFGSGPGPTLSVMFEEQGCRMDLYDPYYAPDEAVFTRQYDFVTATEVVEHLYQPAKELDRLWSLIRLGGWLGIMTKRVDDTLLFSQWHYKNDPTHVVFFSERCFHWLAGRWETRCLFPLADVVLIQKPDEIG
jgi:hypothetical protein